MLRVGTSSRDLPHAVSVEVEAPSIAPPLNRDSTLVEWLADPRGSNVLQTALKGSPAGGQLDDPDWVQVVGTMPLSTLANFGMAGFTHVLLDDLVSKLD